MYGPPKKDDRDHVMYFLEMCPGGALSSVLKIYQEEEKTKRFPVSEGDMWSIFHCLARGVTAMDRGTEDMWKVLVGYSDEIHKRCPIVKIGDFGDAMEIRRLELQTDETGKEDVHFRGAIACRPPMRILGIGFWEREPKGSELTPPIGTIGPGSSTPPPRRGHAPIYQGNAGVMDDNANLRKGETMGTILDHDEDYRNAYSQALRH
ncbi:hypothetical protein NHQ30_002270 [Ciborinia camelliae]|nr:hypothetical protein NHQ30_002270 [Ciborinia camelliae]